MGLGSLKEGEAGLLQIDAQSKSKALANISEGPPCILKEPSKPQFLGGAHQRATCICHRGDQVAGEYETSVVERTRHTVIWLHLNPKTCMLNFL